MNTTTHLHLILNHAPVFGSVFGAALLAVALFRKSAELKTTALALFVAVAILAIPVYLTGEPAEDSVKSLPGVSKAIVEQHEEAAGVALAGVELLGFASLAGIVIFRRGRPTPAWFTSSLLVGALVVAAATGWTAHLGGQVRHTEIRPSAESSLIPLEQPASPHQPTTASL